RVRFPQGPGIRNDAGIYRGYEIPVFYDSLLAKLVVWGADREQARRRMLRALHEFVLEGVRTNLSFHRWLAAHPAFAAGDLSPGFIGAHCAPGSLPADRETTEVVLLAAALHARDERSRVTLPTVNGGGRSTWKWAERRRTGRVPR